MCDEAIVVYTFAMKLFTGTTEVVCICINMHVVVNRSVEVNLSIIIANQYSGVATNEAVKQLP